jgi:hypothetical protein
LKSFCKPHWVCREKNLTHLHDPLALVGWENTRRCEIFDDIKATFPCLQASLVDARQKVGRGIQIDQNVCAVFWLLLLLVLIFLTNGI